SPTAINKSRSSDGDGEARPWKRFKSTSSSAVQAPPEESQRSLKNFFPPQHTPTPEAVPAKQDSNLQKTKNGLVTLIIGLGSTRSAPEIGVLSKRPGDRFPDDEARLCHADRWCRIEPQRHGDRRPWPTPRADHHHGRPPDGDGGFPPTPHPTFAPASPGDEPTAGATAAVDPVQSKASWSKIFTKPAAPRCQGHDEPCVRMLTKKHGINRGRSFWMCSRPLGPSGNQEKKTQWRCHTFIWCSDWNPRDAA
ncbi:MAG: hypothetical protein Q9214_007454, partial [Letrouitia sp. 1 TL-2023]